MLPGISFLKKVFGNTHIGPSSILNFHIIQRIAIIPEPNLAIRLIQEGSGHKELKQRKYQRFGGLKFETKFFQQDPLLWASKSLIPLHKANINRAERRLSQVMLQDGPLFPQKKIQIGNQLGNLNDSQTLKKTKRLKKQNQITQIKRKKNFQGLR
ncbi:hypothetical protein TTHERM_00348430 (macronuclear) [Tetrahymena thermophila SB210]|uniref:Uncharacterized protein n=1 Tax=Tetrahymena thermophila (strain SB210) TaxID=312017 RepID=I7MLN4_TETTS|nr:hypothetical protein TTHERM_00348430 [Tetrahymena thermophila SB210]EAS02753.1 hypothetical protein TTHERM_00348430 [Tetrahymena thermophila SB210]|eukprot:XP_001022998.1 hypothetical protein TTHERM_00348430 [Tetrahymena thermophila SB210]